MSSHADTIREAKDDIGFWASSHEQEFCVGADESKRVYDRVDEVLAALDALLAENQQLEADRLEAIRLAKKTQRLRERAMAENQRLRDALEQIERMSRPCGAYGRVDYGSLPAASKIARAALAAVRVEER